MTKRWFPKFQICRNFGKLVLAFNILIILSLSFTSQAFSAPVFAFDGEGYASTGTLVFGHGQTSAAGGAIEWRWNEDARIFRADFDTPVSYVAIDVIADNTGRGSLAAFDIGGNLISIVHSGTLFSGEFEPLSISSPDNIATIYAADFTSLGAGTCLLDNFQFNDGSGLVFVEPDDFSPGADISNGFAGVTLSKVEGFPEVLTVLAIYPTQGGYGSKIWISGLEFGDQRSGMFNGTQGYHSFVTLSDGVDTMIATDYPLWSGTEVDVLFWRLFIDANGDYLQDGDEPFLPMSQLSSVAYAVIVNTIWFTDNNDNDIYDGGDTVTDTFSSNSEYFALTSDPIVTISITPDTTSVELGHSLGFTASVTNNTDIAGTVLVGTRATKPAGGLTGNLLGPAPVYLQPRETKSGHYLQPIPSGAPTGTYIYRGYVGKQGSGIYDQDYFYFEVESSSGGCSACHGGGGGGHHGSGLPCTACH